jgi:uroporphyrinogen decarboxylase
MVAIRNTDQEHAVNTPTSARRTFIKSAPLALMGSLAGIKSALAAASPAGQSKAKPARSKRDLMADVLNASSTPNYVPAAFFMHFGVRGDAHVKAHLDYFHATNMDFVKIQFDEQEFALNNEIKTPGDWSKIPVLPEKWFEPSLYLLKSLIKEAKSEALIIQTLYSPYQMAKQIVPWNLLVEHVSQDAEAVSRGMESITLSLMHFVQAAARLGVDGFYTCTQGGETNRIANRALFQRAIKSYDMILYKETAHLAPYNIMHICDYDGSYADFDARFQDYPGRVVNVPLTADGKPMTLRHAAQFFKRPVMGGLDRHGVLSTGSPDEAKRAAIEVLKDAPPNFVLGADCTVSPKTPIENLRAAIKTAHEFRLG